MRKPNKSLARIVAYPRGEDGRHRLAYKHMRLPDTRCGIIGLADSDAALKELPGLKVKSGFKIK